MTKLQRPAWEELVRKRRRGITQKNRWKLERKEWDLARPWPSGGFWNKFIRIWQNLIRLQHSAGLSRNLISMRQNLTIKSGEMKHYMHWYQWKLTRKHPQLNEGDPIMTAHCQCNMSLGTSLILVSFWPQYIRYCLLFKLTGLREIG